VLRLYSQWFGKNETEYKAWSSRKLFVKTQKINNLKDELGQISKNLDLKNVK